MPTQEELLQQALAEMKLASWNPTKWAEAIENGYPPGVPYNYEGTRNFKAQLKLWEASRYAPPIIPAPFGTAPLFSGRGIMLGGNEDVWEQALVVASQGQLESVAIIPSSPAMLKEDFEDLGVKVSTWYPPEVTGERVGKVEQAENQTEWNRISGNSPTAIALNSWAYGHFPLDTVAIVEAYYNEGWGLNFEEFRNYMPMGARGVIPLCGGYSAAGRSDDEAAAIYQGLATWSGGKFPGFWMYAGESLITSQSLQVLVNWRP